MTPRDRFGIGWRAPLAGGILAHLDRLDVLEVVAEEWFDARPRDLAALRSLAREVPVHLHGVSLGAASTVPVARERLDAWARLVDVVRPERWSEHLAFVRGGDREIGHLAAPPRTARTLEGLAANAERARRAVGAAPLLENVATLIEPPGSDRDEERWLAEAPVATGCDLLLDLHNLHANGLNFGFDAGAVLARLPLERVGAVHLAGGRFVGRVLDDHLHPVPDAVYALLEALAARAEGPLTVILERDGAFPPFADLLGEVDRARESVAAGRRSRELARV